MINYKLTISSSSLEELKKILKKECFIKSHNYLSGKKEWKAIVVCKEKKTKHD